MKTICLILLSSWSLTFFGCVTRGYKLAGDKVPPAVPLHIVSAPSAGEATLESVIVYTGPGSWKREAYWDEYVVAIVNHREAPLVITAAKLTSRGSESQFPGTNPWALEKISKEWWEKNAVRETGTYLALGAGTALGGGVAFSAAMSTVWGGGAMSTAGVIGATAFVALPVIAGGTVFMNVHRKHQVEAEFIRRRLVLPLTLGPGQSAHGSFFFRITPEPQELSFDCHVGDQSTETKLDLAPIAALHLMAKSLPHATAP